jgi:hypothetical protein
MLYGSPIRVCTLTNAMSKINNFLPYFPDGKVDSKYSESELIGILQFAVPDYYMAAFDQKDYIPTENSKSKFISRSVNESNETQSPGLTSEMTMTTIAKPAKKSSLQNLRNRTKKVAQDRLQRILVCFVRMARLTRITRRAVTS